MYGSNIRQPAILINRFILNLRSLDDLNDPETYEDSELLEARFTTPITFRVSGNANGSISGTLDILNDDYDNSSGILQAKDE